MPHVCPPPHPTETRIPGGQGLWPLPPSQGRGCDLAPQLQEGSWVPSERPPPCLTCPLRDSLLAARIWGNWVCPRAWTLGPREPWVQGWWGQVQSWGQKPFWEALGFKAQSCRVTRPPHLLLEWPGEPACVPALTHCVGLSCPSHCPHTGAVHGALVSYPCPPFLQPRPGGEPRPPPQPLKKPVPALWASLCLGGCQSLTPLLVPSSWFARAGTQGPVQGGGYPRRGKQRQGHSASVCPQTHLGEARRGLEVRSLLPVVLLPPARLRTHFQHILSRAVPRWGIVPPPCGPGASVPPQPSTAHSWPCSQAPLPLLAPSGAGPHDCTAAGAVSRSRDTSCLGSGYFSLETHEHPRL